MLRLDHKLQHLELVILHDSHMLHLLLVDALGLLQHARVTTLRLLHYFSYDVLLGDWSRYDILLWDWSRLLTFR